MQSTIAIPTRPKRKFVPEDLIIDSWDKIKSLFDNLVERKITSATELEAWMLDQSELSAVLEEDMAWRYIKMNIVPTKLKTGDEVVVVTGKDKGKKGTLRKILKAKNKGFVTGINMVKKHTKPNPEMGITGGVVEQEAAIELSNIAIWNPSKKSKDKISYSKDSDGKKIRLFKSDKKEIK